MGVMDKFIDSRRILFVIGIILIAVAFAFSQIVKPANKNKEYQGIVSQENLEGDTAYISFVSSTEYTSKDTNGSTIVKLRDSKNNFINTTCYEVILYPNRTIYFPEILMFQDFFFGEYFMNFEVPDTTGVYSQEVNCEFKGKNVSSAKAFHISVLGDRVLASTNAINGTLNLILDTLNCTSPNYTALCDYLKSINSSQSNNTYFFSNTSSSLSEIINIVTNISQSHEQMEKIHYEVSAPSCQIGSYWVFQANVTNEQYENLPFLDCQLNTTRFGLQPVPFNRDLQRYTITNLCNTPDGLVDWDFNCVRNY